MGLFDSYRQRRVGLTGRESVATLDYMGDFFQGGANWTQGTYHGPDGTKCLVGAADHVRESSIDDAKYWLRQAIAEYTAGAITTIEGFNDTRQSFGEIQLIIARAKQLAAAAQLPAPMPVRALPAPVLHGEILPALPAPTPVFAPAFTPGRIIDLVPVPHQSVPSTPPARRRSLADWTD